MATLPSTVGIISPTGSMPRCSCRLVHRHLFYGEWGPTNTKLAQSWTYSADLTPQSVGWYWQRSAPKS
jgi:hypothetical protein